MSLDGNARLKNRARIETPHLADSLVTFLVTPGLKTGRGLKLKDCKVYEDVPL